MGAYFYLVALHVVSAAAWLAMIPAEFVLSKYIGESKEKSGERKLISVWLKVLNLTGMIGLSGLTITGILMVLQMPVYGFFQLDANHWLTTKQVLTVVLIIMTGVYFIPVGKKIRIAVGDDLEKTGGLSEETYKNIRKLSALAKITIALVTINFVFGLLHSVVHLF